MDNRIFNNLKQQLNEMISDEKSLIPIEEFQKMFFTYFKGEFKAKYLYEKLLPHVVVWQIGDAVFNDVADVSNAELLLDAEKIVSIQKLTKFIDGFNFSPVKVSDIHYKNNSEEMTYIMTSNTKGNLADQD